MVPDKNSVQQANPAEAVETCVVSSARYSCTNILLIFLNEALRISREEEDVVLSLTTLLPI